MPGVALNERNQLEEGKVVSDTHWRASCFNRVLIGLAMVSQSDERIISVIYAVDSL